MNGFRLASMLLIEGQAGKTARSLLQLTMKGVKLSRLGFRLRDELAVQLTKRTSVWKGYTGAPFYDTWVQDKLAEYYASWNVEANAPVCPQSYGPVLRSPELLSSVSTAIAGLISG